MAQPPRFASIIGPNLKEFGRTRARLLASRKATKLVMLGSNLHIECKMFDLNIDRNLIKWQIEPGESGDEA